MQGKNESAKSRLKISEDVIITVARLAALDVKGVAGLDGDDASLKKLGGGSPISVSFMGDVASVDLKIILKNGAKVPAVASEVQNAVKENIQNMTGVAVARVNVAVQGIAFD